MSVILNYTYHILVDPVESKDGEAFANWPLTGAAWPIVLINIFYVSFVFRIGPYLMRNRPAYKLKSVLLVYNLCQIALNLYVGVVTTHFLFIRWIFDLGCVIKLPEHHMYKHIEVQLTWIYFINKYMDYLDTIFFVLKKNYKQVSFLHVYHHLLMSTMGYIYIRFYGYGGHMVSIGLLNSFVHVLMYAYYAVSAVNPTLPGLAWIKLNITRIQILQFVLIIMHQLYPLIFRPDCTYPKVWIFFAILQAVVMILLFSNFYIQTYKKKASKAPTNKESKKVQ